jgi:hypothetical protein
MRSVWDRVDMPPADKRDKLPDDGEIEWSRACAEASAVDVQLYWGDGYTPTVRVRGADDFRVPVIDRTSEKLNCLPFEVAVLLVALLARRAELAAEAIWFPRPTQLVDRPTLLEWVRAIRLGREDEVVEALAALAEQLRLPWEESVNAG